MAKLRAFVGLVRTERGYRAHPVVADDLDQAQRMLHPVEGELVVVLDQSQVTMLGMGLAAGRVVLEERGDLQA